MTVITARRDATRRCVPRLVDIKYVVTRFHWSSLQLAACQYWRHRRDLTTQQQQQKQRHRHQCRRPPRLSGQQVNHTAVCRDICPFVHASLSNLGQLSNVEHYHLPSQPSLWLSVCRAACTSPSTLLLRLPSGLLACDCTFNIGLHRGDGPKNLASVTFTNWVESLSNWKCL